MTGQALLAALPCAALGLALCRTTWREAITPVAACIVAALVANLLLGGLSAEVLVVTCGLTTALTALPVYLNRAPHPLLMLILAVNAGVWTGALAGLSHGVLGLLFSLPWIAAKAPAGWVVQRRWQVALKVIASWMVAIALLAVALNSVSMPSYQLDHME